MEELYKPLRSLRKKSVYLAYSGGSDSSAMLHAMHSVGLKDVQCVYVDHGWSELGQQWKTWCQRQVEKYGYHFTSFSIQARSMEGEGLEDASRKGRYECLSSVLDAHSVMCVAQHADDQAETLLIQLLRGKGVEGLAGMPRSQPLGKGTMLRPWLDVGKDTITQYIHKHSIEYIDDPSNADTHLDRNFIRHHIIPAMKEHRWIQAPKLIARTAEHLQAHLLVQKDWYVMKKKECSVNGQVSVRKLRSMEAPVLSTFIKMWLEDEHDTHPTKLACDLITHSILQKKGGVTIQWEKGQAFIKGDTIEVQKLNNFSEDACMLSP